MHPKDFNKKLKLNTPVGIELINKIKSLMDIKIGLNDKNDLILSIHMDNNQVSEEVTKFITSPVKSSSEEGDDSMNQEYCLTACETQIMEKVIIGKSNKEIANELNKKINTVKNQLKIIFIKLKVRNRQEAIIAYMKMLGKILETENQMLEEKHVNYLKSLN